MVITFLFSISVKNDLHILKEHTKKKTLQKNIVSFNFSAYSQLNKIWNLCAHEIIFNVRKLTLNISFIEQKFE